MFGFHNLSNAKNLFYKIAGLAFATNWQRHKPTKSDLFCEIKYLLKQIYGAITKKQKQFILYFDLTVWNKIAMLRAKNNKFTTTLQNKIAYLFSLFCMVILVLF